MESSRLLLSLPELSTFHWSHFRGWLPDDCNLEPGPHTITLAGSDSDYVLTFGQFEFFGYNAFPPIIQEIRIYGGGIALTRANDIDPAYQYGKFRFFVVDAKNPGHAGKLTISAARFFNGDSGTYGGGALLNDGETYIDECHFSGNNAGTYGGAIYAGDDKPLILLGATFSNNTATGEEAHGGAIYASANSELTINNCFFFRNFVNGTDSRGSAIYTYAGVVATALNCYISCNETIGSSYHEAVYAGGPSFSAIYNWWGADDGPDGGGVSGSGQVVGGTIDADPFNSSTTNSKYLPIWYNRYKAGKAALERSRSNFEGSFFEVGSGDTTSNAHGSVGGPFTYPSTGLTHSGLSTGSAIFMSECMFAGDFPMIYGIDTNGNLDPDCSQGAGDELSGWRICTGETNWATGTWRGHPVLRDFIESHGGFVVNGASLQYDDVALLVNYSANNYGIVTDAQGLRDLFNYGGAYHEVRTGDYIVINQGEGEIYHGFLIVGWGPAIDSLDGINARLDSETGASRTEITYHHAPDTVPYVADFCYGYKATSEVPLTDPEYQKTGWLQDPRPRPFYCSAVSVTDDSEFDEDVVGMPILGTGNYWERLRTAFAAFIFDDNNPNTTQFPNWLFVHLPDVIEVRYDRFYCPSESV